MICVSCSLITQRPSLFQWRADLTFPYDSSYRAIFLFPATNSTLIPDCRFRPRRGKRTKRRDRAKENDSAESGYRGLSKELQPRIAGRAGEELRPVYGRTRVKELRSRSVRRERERKRNRESMADPYRFSSALLSIDELFINSKKFAFTSRPVRESAHTLIQKVRYF